MNAIRNLRSLLGLTQKELAIRAQTSQPTIALYEAGKKSPTLETLERITKALGLELSLSFTPPLTREDRRSLAYHREIVKKLKSNPDKIISKAHKNLKTIEKHQPHAKHLINSWRQWLDYPVQDLTSACLDPSLFARDMRQVTPFAGILSASERTQIIKKFRKENP
jgi:transcriptional regulator with XRE-family HTH domain